MYDVCIIYCIIHVCTCIQYMLIQSTRTCTCMHIHAHISMLSSVLAAVEGLQSPPSGNQHLGSWCHYRYIHFMHTQPHNNALSHVPQNSIHTPKHFASSLVCSTFNSSLPSSPSSMSDLHSTDEAVPTVTGPLSSSSLLSYYVCVTQYSVAIAHPHTHTHTHTHTPRTISMQHPTIQKGMVLHTCINV